MEKHCPLTLNQRVLGSSPSASTKISSKINRLEQVVFGMFAEFFATVQQTVQQI